MMTNALKWTCACVILIASFLVMPSMQGLLVYMNFPYYWLIDFQRPSESQVMFAGIERTSHFLVNSTQGVQLGVWHTKPIEIHENNRVVLYLHGNGESRAYPWGLAKYRLLAQHPFNAHVISFDYRGFGDSTGWPNEKGLYDDAENVFRWLLTEYIKIPADQIVLYGHSLGSAVATHLASQQCRLNQCPGAVILESPFTSLVDVVDGFVPIPGLRAVVASVLQHPFESLARIHNVTCPVLIAHGAKDGVIALKQGKQLFERRRQVHGDSTSFIEIEMAGHSDVANFPEFQSHLLEWWQKL